MNRIPSRSAWLHATGQIVGVVLVVAMYVGVLSLTTTGSAAWFTALMIPTLLLALFVFSIVYEFGRVLGGWMTGMRIVRVSFGPLQLQRQLRGLAIERRQEWRGTLLVLSSERRQRRQLLGSVLGPSVALMVLSAVLAYAALLAVARVETPFSTVDPPSAVVQFGTLFLLFLALLVPGLFVAALAKAAVTDLQHLDRRSDAGDQRYWAMREVERLSYTGVRPRDWEADWLGRFAAPVPSTRISVGWNAIQRARGLLLVALHALDDGKPDEAASRLDEALADTKILKHTIGLRSDILLWRYIIAALYERDASMSKDLAGQSLREIQDVDRHLPPLAQAALALAQEDYDRAFERVKASLVLFPLAVDAGKAHLELELVEWMIAEATVHWTNEQHATVTTHIGRVRELLSTVGHERADSERDRDGWALGQLVPRAALVTLVALITFATPVLAGTHIADMRSDSGGIFKRPAQWGDGSDPDTVRALLSVNDMPNGWYSWRADDAHRFVNGAAMPCSRYALFADGAVTRYARGGFDHRSADVPFFRQVVTQTDEALAIRAMEEIRDDRECFNWDDESGTEHWIEPLDIPAIGDESIGYLHSTHRESDDTFWETNVVVARVGGMIISISHGRLDAPPDAEQSLAFARQATDKVARASAVWEPVPPTEPEASELAESSGGLTHWGGGVPVFLALPVIVYLYVCLVYLFCQLLVVRLERMQVRCVVLLPLVAVKSAGGVRVRLRWIRPWSHGNPFAASYPALPADEQETKEILTRLSATTLRVGVGMAVVLLAVTFALRVWLDLWWLWTAILLIAPGSLLLSALSVWRQRTSATGQAQLDEREEDAAFAFTRVVWSLLGGVRPGELRSEDIRSLAKQANDVADASSLNKLLLVHEYFLERGETQRAGETIKMALDLMYSLPAATVPGSVKSHVLRSAAWIEARYEHDAVEARRLLSQATSPSIDRYYEALVDGAVLLAEGARSQARMRIEYALRYIGDSVLPSQTHYSNEQARLMLAELDDSSMPPVITPPPFD